MNAAYKVFATNQYKKAPTSEIAAEAGISKSLLFHYFHNKLELYLFLWNHATDLTKEYMSKYKVYETEDFFEMMRRGLKAKCVLMHWYRSGNYDVDILEQEYLEMIDHWEMVYGKGDRK